MPLINPGQRAPAFSLPDQNGRMHELSKHLGKPVVLYFYPKDDTPGCTIQACAFRDHLPHFRKSQAEVFGVSPDDSSSHAKFAEKFNLNFTLLADHPEGNDAPPVCDAYGVWQERMMYGRRMMGVVRTTYLIDPQGKVAQRWDKVKVEGHAEEVLAAVGDLYAQRNAKAK
jgi:peroxiredoxin Q/BCP